jgi:thiamine-monophosphate kinase
MAKMSARLKTVSQCGEFGLIEQIRRRLSTNSAVVKGIGDDTAIVESTKDKYLLLTTDMMVEDVHFSRSTPPRLVGQKAMSCNISDIAAMGGLPRFALVSVGFPKTLPVQYVKELYEGMEKQARHFHIAIVGGDTVASDKIMINIALTGDVDKKKVVMRSGAKRGDLIFVTGPLGQSLKTKHHLTFTPRLKESQFLIKNIFPHAMIDISDGLAADLGHILKASRVGAVLNAEDIPRRNKATITQALSDGEDFELLFTVPKKKAGRILQMKNYYQIGSIINEPGRLYIQNTVGKKTLIPLKGYTHFS